MPIFVGIIGGVIAYFVLRHDDLPKAKNCLYLGIALSAVGIMLNGLALSQIDNTEIGLGFIVNS